MVHVDSTGFSASQLADIRSAISWLSARTGVPLRYVAAPGENWLPDLTTHIIIERHRVVDDRGNVRGAYSKPYDRNGDGWYDAGQMWIDQSSDVHPAGRGWGYGGSNFFKFVVHELSHQLGVADVGDPQELMGSISVDQPGWGDDLAWQAVGC